MENMQLKKENGLKVREKTDINQEKNSMKRFNLLSRLSSNKFSQNEQSNNKSKQKKYDNNNKDIITKHKFKLPSELITKRKNIALNPKQKNLNNEIMAQSEIEEKHIVFKKTSEDKKKLLGQIITDFSSNKKLNNNIFDDGNQLTCYHKDNKENNTINNDIFENKETENQFNTINRKYKKINNIQEIKLNKNISNSPKTMKLAVSSARGNYYKRRPFYIVGINKKNNNATKIEETPVNNNIIELKANFSKNLSPKTNNTYRENLLEKYRKRNKYKDNKFNNLTYNDNNKDQNKDNNNEYNQSKINNINNINNNISLNNRYNFYIKIGKNNKIDVDKDNKDINCEIKLTSPSNEVKDGISSHVIKKLIVECDIDKINKNLNIDNKNKKEINVNVKPFYKKIEIEKIVVSNKNDELDKKDLDPLINNRRAKIRSSNSFNNKSFKFLIHQAYNNKNLSTSFNRYYKSGQSLRGRSQKIRDNINNNDSFNNSNLAPGESCLPLGLKFYKSEKIDSVDNNREKSKKYKSFYRSFRNIGKYRKNNNISCEENQNEKNNEIIESNIQTKENNITLIQNNNENKTNNDNLDITPVSISISNTNNDENNKNNNLDNKIIFNKKGKKMRNIIYSFEGMDNQLNTIDSKLVQSKINTSFSTNNSNLNSVSSTNNNNININIKNNSSITNNLAISFINLEILYVLEEKLKLIIEKINNYERCGKECYDFINYYFTHHFNNDALRLFKYGPNRKVINNYLKIEILCYFICYDISFIEDFKKVEILLKSIFIILHKNFLIFLKLIISQYKNKENNIIIALNKIVKDNLYNNDDDFNENINYNELDEYKFIEIIEMNLKKIVDYCRMLIENIYYKYLKGKNNYIKFPDCINFINPNSLNRNKLDIFISNFFIQAFKSISEYNFDVLKKLFYSFLYFKQSLKTKKGNLISGINDKIPHYLLPKIKNHKYTLVLDLDETLVYTQRDFHYKFQNNKINLPEKRIILRPGLHEFLHDMKLLFELVIFSSGTPDYVDPIIKMIEKEEKFFDYILYRQHITSDENGDNIKNLNLIGRDLKNVIIIDDISKYFKLQKENGICIKPFCGNFISDRKTLKTLNSILQKIRFDADETKDIRISLEKYRNLLYPIVNNGQE